VEFQECRRLIAESGLFDPNLYRRLNPEIARFPDPLDHYVRVGGFECRRAHKEFDAHWYTTGYADVLTSGLHPLVHYILVGRAQARSVLPPAALFDVAGAMISEAAEIDQSVSRESRLSEPEFLPVVKGGIGGSTGVLMLKAWNAIFDVLPGAFDYLVFAPWLTRGGADVVVVNILRAAIQQYGPGSTLLVLADSANSQAVDWLPDGTHVLCFSHACGFLPHAIRVQLVISLIYAMRPKAVMNVNSASCWDAFATKGKALNQITRLFGCLFCSDYGPDGKPGGYADTHFRDTFECLTRVYSDNQTFVKQLVKQHGIPQHWQSKFALLRQPPLMAPAHDNAWLAPGKRRVLWTGRFCRQKNIGLLIDIAKRAPDIHFEVYGYGDEDSTRMLEAASCSSKNLCVRGAYASFMSLPLSDYDVYLYTSLWDGLPNALVEAGCMGMPVVASASGGVAELISANTGWLVGDLYDPEPYIDALREACDHPEEAAARARQLKVLIKSRHTMEALVASLNESPAFLE
jgi:glycosyltransferase involved in cell wall biosynthesis